ncbi:MAG: hypothetical protein ACXU9O_05640 [Gemmatimonadaceae bacterium]
MKHLVVVGVALMLSASNAVAQASPGASPADVARDFFAAERDGRWLDAAHLLDLKSFEPQRAQSVANARRARDTHPFHLTVDQILRHDPSMPRAVAEYQVKQAEQSFRDFNPLTYEYADVPTADSLAALPVDVAAARWLEAKDPRWLMKRQARSSGECAQVYDSLLKRPSALDSVAASMFMLPRPEVVAVASGGSTAGSADSLSYVIFRERYETTLDSTARPRMAVLPMQMSPSVLTMIRTPAGWKVQPVQDLGYAHGTFGFSYDCAIDSVKPRAKKK